MTLASTDRGTSLPTPTGWRDQAKCRDHNPALFTPATDAEAHQAMRICNGHDGRPVCPVRDQCLIEGLAGQVGVWGGRWMTGRTRHASWCLACGRAVAGRRKYCSRKCGDVHHARQTAERTS